MEMSLTLALALVLGTAVVAWADPVDELKACQAQVETLTMQTQQARQERSAYVSQLGELIAEMRAQLVERTAQLQALIQETQRLKASKPLDAAKSKEKK